MRRGQAGARRDEPLLVGREPHLPARVALQQPVGSDHVEQRQLVLGRTQLEVVVPDAVRAVVGEQQEHAVLVRVRVRARGRVGVRVRVGTLSCSALRARRRSSAARCSSREGSRSMKCSCATMVLTLAHRRGASA